MFTVPAGDDERFHSMRQLWVDVVNVGILNAQIKYSLQNDMVG
jgi:ribosomal protein L20